ncbi:MAG TPA: hypothetical protein VEH31_25320, partial [Streptosporangiaceae bacterium]|nr:hypothetical protein [Streptosporangiaceae bacterium]
AGFLADLARQGRPASTVRAYRSDLAAFIRFHPTELVNAGVSLETIRRRLGHANAQTVLRYADQHDTTTDAQVRAWRRRKTTRRSAS